MRSDKKAKIILSDEKQLKEPFRSLFEDYEALRNSSVHFSPGKTRIWLKPHDWVKKAQESSKLTIEVALLIWKSCHESDKGPDYLGRLEFDRLIKIAENREMSIKHI